MNFGERTGVAKTCTTSLKLPMPTLVDTMDNAVNYKYSAWPDRIYVVDAQGRIAVQAAHGPRGFKAGVFDTVIGYESTDRNNNPFHSHSWGKSIEPTQHTGFLFDYKLTENLKLYAGVANSTSPKINGLSDNDNRFTFIGAADFMVPEEFWGLGGSTFTLGTVNGRPWDQGNNNLDPIREEYYYFGGRIPTPWEDLTLGVAWDLKRTEGGGNDDQVLGGYLSYRATDILELNLRGEKFEAGNGLGSSMSDGWGVTSGFTYQLWNNTKARFEYRYDRTDLPVGGKNGNKTLIWNLIYSF